MKPLNPFPVRSNLKSPHPPLYSGRLLRGSAPGVSLDRRHPIGNICVSTSLSNGRDCMHTSTVANLFSIVASLALFRSSSENLRSQSREMDVCWPASNDYPVPLVLIYSHFYMPFTPASVDGNSAMVGLVVPYILAGPLLLESKHGIPEASSMAQMTASHICHEL